ncbi:MAG: ImmA/IrrE family metallo-endopeptidase [Terriglobales bacterium]
MPHVAVKPALLRWASERSGIPWDKLEARFSGLADWQRGRREPTLNQLESFAAATHVPLGKLFLEDTPEEPLPLPDFRSQGNLRPRQPSGNLLDTIYVCQIRQEWYRDYALSEGEGLRHSFGGAAADPAEAAANLREVLQAQTPFSSSPATALRHFTELAEAMGVLVMASGIVGNDTHRVLSVEEFRGFVMADERVPLIFINAADSPRAQLFTLAHELAHVTQHQSAVSEAEPSNFAARPGERWCNQVAAALLVPDAELTVALQTMEPGSDLPERLRQRFPVSPAVALIRARELGLIRQSQLDAGLAASRPQLLPRRRPAGGNFYNTQGRRLGRRFPTAIFSRAQEGSLPLLDAMRLLGVRTVQTFDRLAAHLGTE